MLELGYNANINVGVYTQKFVNHTETSVCLCMETITVEVSSEALFSVYKTLHKKLLMTD